MGNASSVSKKLEASVPAMVAEVMAKVKPVIQQIAGETIKKNPAPKKDVAVYLKAADKELDAAEQKSLAALQAMFK